MLQPAPAATAVRKRRRRWGDTDSESEEEPAAPAPVVPPRPVSLVVNIIEAIPATTGPDCGMDVEAPLRPDELKWLYSTGYNLAFAAPGATEDDVATDAFEHPPLVITRRKAQDTSGVGFKVIDASGDPDIYRWSWASSLCRAIQSEASASDAKAKPVPQHLSIVTWNSGRARQGRFQEHYRSGAWHILIAQEFDVLEQGSDLHRLGWLIQSCGSIAVGCRVHLASSIVVLHHENTRDLEGAVFVINFERPVLEAEFLVVASLHINNVRASSTSDAMVDAVLGFLARGRERSPTGRIDIVGVDYNQARQSFVTALERDTSTSGSEGAAPMIIRTPTADCVALALPRGSVLGRSRLHRGVFFPHLNLDIGVRPRDADSHWLVAGHFRPNTKTGARNRSEASMPARIARKNARRHARKAGLPEPTFPAAPAKSVAKRPQQAEAEAEAEEEEEEVEVDRPRDTQGVWPENGDWEWREIPPPATSQWRAPLPRKRRQPPFRR